MNQVPKGLQHLLEKRESTIGLNKERRKTSSVASVAAERRKSERRKARRKKPQGR